MRRLLSLAASVVWIGLSMQVGCDYLPEAITGRPNPTAPQLEPAGPTGQTVLVEQTNQSPPPATPLSWPSSATSASVTTATVDAATPAEGVIQTSGASLDSQGPGTLEAAVLESPALGVGEAPTAGLEVPAANRSQPPAQPGQIIINNAYLRFVYDSPIAAPADGVIVELQAEEGLIVRKDALLARIDDRLAQSELEVTTKEYEAAVEKASDRSEIEFAKAGYDVAKEELRMAKEVDARGAGSESELLKKGLEFKRAELAIPVAEIKNRQDHSAAEVAKAKQGAARVQIDLRRLTAPFDGMIAEKQKEQYEWVRAGDTLLRLISMEQLRVVGQVRTSQLSQAPHELVGMVGTIDIELYPGRVERVNGKVGYVSPTLESSGGYKIWLQISNIQANGQWVFREGMPARIELQTR
jgi:multidrug resistance efflux pump